MIVPRFPIKPHEYQKIPNLLKFSYYNPRYFKVLTSHRSHYTFVEKCPPPTLDTGCTYCMPKIPEKKPLDFTKQLRGTAGVSYRHLIIYTGQQGYEWSSKIDLQPESMASEIGMIRRKILNPMFPILVTNSDLPSIATAKKSYSALLIPTNEEFSDIPQDSILLFMKAYLNPKDSCDLTEEERSKAEALFKPIENKNPIILVCGHKSRDIRCGLLAPPIIEEFKHILKKEGLIFDADKNPSGIKVGTVSHIGGHAYAGNVIYIDKSGESIWYGRVRPEHVQGIISETVQKGRIIEELYRGNKS